MIRSLIPELPVEEFHLDNGLRLLCAPDATAPVVSFQVHYAAGSRHERPGITGISHLFEHMMFKGSQAIGPEEHARIIQALGGNLNAFTTADQTTYYNNLPAHQWETAARLEAERMARLSVTPENLTSEREVVRNERKLRIDNAPTGTARERFFALAYDSHPYGWPVAGWDWDLRAISEADCLAFYHTYYAPGNATAIVVGDVEPAAALATVRTHFDPVPARPVPPAPVVDEPPQLGEKRAILKKVAQSPALFIGFHTVPLGHPDLAPLAVLDALLNVGEASLLYQRLIKPGQAVRIWSLIGMHFPNQDTSLYHYEIVGRPGQDLAPLEATFLAALEEVATLADPRALDRARHQVQAALLRELATVENRGVQLGLYQLRAGDFRRLWGFLEALAAVGWDDVHRVIHRYCHPDNRTVLQMLPVTPEEWERLHPEEDGPEAPNG